MKYNLESKQTLGEIVAIYPGAVQVFNKHKIDFCCGGFESLKQALSDLGIEEEEFLQSLNEGYTQFMNSKEHYKDWRQAKPVELMDHILETHHVYTKKTLVEIDQMLFKVLKVHYKHHSEELLKVHTLFGALKTELQQHLIKEEENLFPLIEKYEATNDQEVLKAIFQFIKDTEDEHDVAGDVFKELEKATRDFTAPEGACTTFKTVYALMDALEKDVFNHIHLENSVLFKML